MNLARAGLGALLALLAVACGPSSPPVDLRNELVNPGFEAARRGWTYPFDSRHWADFEISERLAHGGLRSLLLPVGTGPGEPQVRVRVHGVMQELRPERFPERLSGWYRVESWEKAPPEADLYLQVVVIVWGDPRTQEILALERPDPRVQNYQLRFYLAGVTAPPFTLSNARLGFVGEPGPPPLGRWVPFEIPLRREFEERWGVVPEGYKMLRVLFEARWDNLPAGGRVRAEVFYDDLYLGE